MKTSIPLANELKLLRHASKIALAPIYKAFASSSANGLCEPFPPVRLLLFLPRRGGRSITWLAGGVVGGGVLAGILAGVLLAGDCPAG